MKSVENICKYGYEMDIYFLKSIEVSFGVRNSFLQRSLQLVLIVANEVPKENA